MATMSLPVPYFGLVTVPMFADMRFLSRYRARVDAGDTCVRGVGAAILFERALHGAIQGLSFG